MGSGYFHQINVAVDTLVTSGIPVVVAAGNHYQVVGSRSPQSSSFGLVVGNTDRDDRINRYFSTKEKKFLGSNYGPRVNIFAPGTQIVSAGIDNDQVFWESTSTQVLSAEASYLWPTIPAKWLDDAHKHMVSLSDREPGNMSQNWILERWERPKTDPGPTSPTDAFIIPFIGRGDKVTFERLAVGNEIRIHVAEDHGPNKPSSPRGTLSVTPTDDLTVVPAPDGQPDLHHDSTTFKVTTFDTKTGIIRLTYGDKKKFPFKFHLRLAQSDPSEYYMVGRQDLARIDKTGFVTLGGNGDLAIFHLTSETFSRPVVRHMDENSFASLAVDQAINIHVFEDGGPNKGYMARGMLVLTNTSPPNFITVHTTDVPPASANFKVKSFDSITGFVRLVYDNDDKSFPFEFCLRSVPYDPTKYHIVTADRALALINTDGTVNFVNLMSGDNPVIFSFVFQRSDGLQLATDIPNGNYKIQIRDSALRLRADVSGPLKISQDQGASDKGVNGQLIRGTYANAYIQPTGFGVSPSVGTNTKAVRIVTSPHAPGYYFIAITLDGPVAVLHCPTWSGGGPVPLTEPQLLDPSHINQQWQFIPA
ncbi:Subtilase [Mycena venus]|uniref:Subtilase n=1 Tax=Mycena venus TaxID=2733690 RepID=A0A8H6XER2_9AGAR|nr:Subtilase [Mycena venus]